MMPSKLEELIERLERQRGPYMGDGINPGFTTTEVLEFLRQIQPSTPDLRAWTNPLDLQNPNGRFLRTASELMKFHGYTHMHARLREMADSLLETPVQTKVDQSTKDQHNSGTA